MKEKNKYRSRRDYFGPLLLITIGFIFLASNLGIIPWNGWSAIWRLWPLLLIIAGINDLIRGEGIVWPLLLVGLGGFVLVNNYFQADWISWSNLLQLWPVILIAIGIDLIFKEKTVWTALIGILLIVVFLGGGYWIVIGGSLSSAGTQSVSTELDSEIQKAEISLNQGAGQILLRDTVSRDTLLEGSLSSGSYQINDGTFESEAVYEIEQSGFGSYPGSNTWDLELNSDVPVDLFIDNGAGELILSLEKLILSSFSVNQGVGRIVVNLPRDGIEEGRITQAVGQMNVSVPEELKVVFVMDKGLSVADFPEGYYQRGNRVYSPGVDENELVTEIILEQAVGQISVRISR
jgi:hypothetical protein